MSFPGKEAQTFKEAMESFALRNGIRNPEDWYEVSSAPLKAQGLLSLISSKGGLFRALKLYRPDFPWKEEQFLHTRHFGTVTLSTCLKKIWPNVLILEDFALTSELTALTISYYTPSLKLGFEYQGAGEYLPASGSGRLTLALNDPHGKAEKLLELGGSLIIIPFWWDRTLESLLGSILECNRELEATFAPTLEGTSSSRKAVPRTVTIDRSDQRKAIRVLEDE